jgi:hypothetical protein
MNKMNYVISQNKNSVIDETFGVICLNNVWRSAILTYPLVVVNELVLKGYVHCWLPPSGGEA